MYRGVESTQSALLACAAKKTGKNKRALSHTTNHPTHDPTTTGSPGAVVAVIDAGAEVSHPRLAGAVWTNAREVPGNGLDDDGNGALVLC